MDKIVAYLIQQGATPEDALMTAQKIMGPQVTLGKATGEAPQRNVPPGPGAGLFRNAGPDAGPRQAFFHGLGKQPESRRAGLLRDWDARQASAPPPMIQFPDPPAVRRASPSHRDDTLRAISAHGAKGNEKLKNYMEKILHQIDTTESEWRSWEAAMRKGNK